LGGRIYNADDGKTTRATLRGDGKTLKVSGCVFFIGEFGALEPSSRGSEDRFRPNDLQCRYAAPPQGYSQTFRTTEKVPRSNKRLDQYDQAAAQNPRCSQTMSDAAYSPRHSFDALVGPALIFQTTCFPVTVDQATNVT